jgi:hypothetical protein
VKFIERQKLTRLEKSVNRQLSAIKEQSTPDPTELLQLQEQLKVIALDQLYVAFYPSDAKYMSLFTNGMTRAVDDERGQKRRKEIWKRIREGLLGDSKDSKAMLADAKSWVNLDVAKKAILEIDENTYPNAPEVLKKITGNGLQSKVKPAKSKQTNNEKKSKPASDNRFILSKEIDEMFVESTSGLDYEEKLAMYQDDSDSSSTNSHLSSDDADPLKEFDAKTGKSKNKDSSSSSDDDEEEQTPHGKAAKEDSLSSSSSSSNSSDSDSEADPKENNSIVHISQNDNKVNEQSDAESSEDDFFASEKISAAQVFKQAENQQYKKHGTDDHYYQSRKGDKSKGFTTQNQTKREFRNFQHRKKRSKLG